MSAAPYSDDLFKRELAKGHRVATRIGEQLVEAGFPARVTPMEFRRDYADRERFKDEVDIMVGQERIEVKSTTYSFSGVGDGFFDPAMVDTVSGFNAKSQMPFAYVIVQQQTGERFVIPTHTRDQWTTRRAYDKVRGIEDEFYFAPRSCWRSWQQFKAALRDA